MNDLPEGFDFLGWYSPPEARRLMTALDEAQIEMLAHFEDGLSGQSASQASFGSFGSGAQVLLAVETARRVDATAIHADLFGDGLPIFHQASEDEADWNADQMEEHSRLILQLDEVQREAQFLVEEVKAIAAELSRPGQSSAQLATWHSALAEHQEKALHLQREQQQLEQALAELEGGIG
jgi:hypothetical protein